MPVVLRAPFQALRFAGSSVTICSSDWVSPTLRSCSWRSIAERDCLRQQVLLAASLGRCGGAASIAQLEWAIWLLAQGQQMGALVARSATDCKPVNSWVFTALMTFLAAVHKSRRGFFVRLARLKRPHQAAEGLAGVGAVVGHILEFF